MHVRERGTFTRQPESPRSSAPGDTGEKVSLQYERVRHVMLDLPAECEQRSCSSEHESANRGDPFRKPATRCALLQSGQNCVTVSTHVHLARTAIHDFAKGEKVPERAMTE